MSLKNAVGKPPNRGLRSYVAFLRGLNMGGRRVIAMADLRQDRLDQSHQALSQKLGDRNQGVPGARVLAVAERLDQIVMLA